MHFASSPRYRTVLVITDTTAQRYTAKDPDVRLMLKVRDDDAAAFEQIVNNYQHRLVSLMTHLVGKRDMAEDLAQDVFLRVYRARKKYVPGSKFSTWLFTIANNVASNARRSLARRQEVNLAARNSGEENFNGLEAQALAASGQMPTRQLDKEELRDIVNLAVATLDDRQKMAVLLNKFEHMSYEEIGEVMQLSTSAVKSLLSRARGNLRDVISPYMKVE